jgi:hypothetical protein
MEQGVVDWRARGWHFEAESHGGHR